jgi:hypothetical protein
MPKKTLSLSNELHLIIDAMGGVQRQVRHVIDDYAADDPDALAGIDAMLVVLRERLRLLDRAVRGTLDPRLVWSPENDATHAPGDPEEDDVRLEVWSDRKLARHHRAERKRAKLRLAQERSSK